MVAALYPAFPWPAGAAAGVDSPAWMTISDPRFHTASVSVINGGVTSDAALGIGGGLPVQGATFGSGWDANHALLSWTFVNIIPPGGGAIGRGPMICFGQILGPGRAAWQVSPGLAVIPPP